MGFVFCQPFRTFFEDGLQFEKNVYFCNTNIKQMDDKVINSIKQSLLLNLPTGGYALLYGSRARGEARSDSDWDILIVLDKDKLLPEDYDIISYPLRELGWELGESINPVMYTAKEWEESKFTPFYHNVIDDAIRLA
jgi:predicted nucleotidyltransferase